MTESIRIARTLVLSGTRAIAAVKFNNRDLVIGGYFSHVF
jgi:hypothetical protein